MVRLLGLSLCILLVGVSSPLSAQEKGFLGKTAHEWGVQLKSGDPKLRRNASFALGKMGKNASQALPAMKAAYRNEKDAKVKEALIFALGEISRDSVNARNDPDLERVLIEAGRDMDPYLRRSAIYALGCLGKKSRETYQAIEAALNDTEAIVRQNAAWAVGQYGLEALPLLRKALRDQDSLVKRDAASSMLLMNDADKVHEYLADLLPLCRDVNSEVRRAVLNVLVRIVEPKDKDVAIAPLLVTLEDRDIEIRRNSALALSNIGGEETAKGLTVLLEAIQNGDEELRRQAVLAIRNIGPAAAPALNDLVRLLDDSDQTVREHAALAIGGLKEKGEPAIPVLLKKLRNPAEPRSLRIECAMALSRIGPVAGAANVAPELVSLMADVQHDIKVRERVMWALRVHRENLRNMPGTKEAFGRILQEPRSQDNRMLRYDCAYMLGMIWRQQAPPETLNVLSEYLDDRTIQIFVAVGTSVTGGTDEIKGGPATVKVSTKGDGRVMAADALQSMGPGVYGSRKDILTKLNAIVADPSAYEPLRKKASALIQAAK